MAAGFIQVGSVQYAANAQNKEVQLNTLDPENDIRSFRISLELTLISTAAAFNIAAGDHYTLVSNCIARVKGSWNFDEAALSATPDDLRVCTQDSQGADCQIEDLRVGDQVPATGGNAVAKKIPIDINFTHQADESPDMDVMTTDQFNASAAKLILDLGALATNGGNVVLANGTALTVVTNIRILGEFHDAYGVRVGPHWTFKRINEAKDSQIDLVPGIERLLYQRSAPATFEAVFSKLTMSVDGRARVRSLSPTDLALDYLRSSVKRDALRGYDITRNSLGGVGSVTPLRWKKAHVRSAEYQQPYHNVERRLEFQLAAGQAPAYDLFQVRSHHVSKIDDVARRLMAAHGLSGDPEALPVYGMGGSDNNSFKQFKGRIIKMRKG